MTKKVISLLRNLAHIGSGVLISSHDPDWKAAGCALALVASWHSQRNTPPRPPTGGVPVAIKHRVAPGLAL